ncbi:MAG: hypothetical protein L0K86_27050, partial [Actinomycetia bacterium]|nr:hypothetical protein [Actinomycetes bacterium]
MTGTRPLRPEQVRFISFEGGGRAGLTICPGVAQGLADLGILRYDSAGRQIGVEGFAGSSSGSVVATLLSCGYQPDEVVTLLSEAAFDLVFRLEEFSLGQFSRLNGGITHRSTPVPPWIAAPSAFDTFDDPVGALLNGAMTTHSMISHSLTSVAALIDSFKRSLQDRIDRIPASTGQAPGWLGTLAGTTSEDLKRRIGEAVIKFGTPQLLAWFDREYPHVVFKLVEHILNPDNRVHVNLSNVFHVLKWDFGIFSGAAWRDYLD